MLAGALTQAALTASKRPTMFERIDVVKLIYAFDAEVEPFVCPLPVGGLAELGQHFIVVNLLAENGVFSAVEHWTAPEFVFLKLLWTSATLNIPLYFKLSRIS